MKMEPIVQFGMIIKIAWILHLQQQINLYLSKIHPFPSCHKKQSQIIYKNQSLVHRQILYKNKVSYKQSHSQKQKMSNITNRNENKSPNPKLARYLQRIEQLVGHRNRTPSPLSTRSPRPLKPNALDHYLKYELTVKILCNVADKKNKGCVRYFFNLLRSRSEHEHTKVQKIYKFVPIEKTQCTHMIIDTGISIKMLTSILKNIYKSNLKQSFNNMKSLILTQSQLMSLNTARSNKSNITPLSGSQIYSNKKYQSTSLVLFKMYIVRMVGCFGCIRNYRNQLNSNNNLKGNVGGNNNFQITVNKYINLDLVKLCYLGALFGKIMRKNVQTGFYRVEEYGRMMEQNQVKELENENIVVQRTREKVYGFGVFLNYKNTRSLISEVKYAIRLARHHLDQQKSKQVQEESLCEDVEKVSAMVSTSTLSKLNHGVVYDGTNKISISLMSIMMRRKMEFMRTLSRYNDFICQGSKQVCAILNKKIHNRLLQSFIKIKAHSQNLKSLRKSSQKNKIWQKIGRIVNINNYFIYTLKQPFKILKDHAINKTYIQENINTIEYYFDRNKLKEGFEKIKNYFLKNRGNRTRSFLDSERLTKQMELLPRILNKLVLLRYTEFFIKLKSKKKSSLKSSNVNSSRNYVGWVSDIESFISQRDRFNRNMSQNYQKISSIINNPNTKQNDRQDTQSPITTRNNTNTKDQAPKVVFSPKNRNIKSMVFPK